MRTTLAFPDPLIFEAKRLALHEGTSLTDLLTQGLEMRLKKARTKPELPISSATGGLASGTDWLHLGAEDEAYR